MSTLDLNAVRANLDHERSDLEHRLNELTNDGSEAPEFDEGFADTAQVAAEQVENLTLAASLRDQLRDVEVALERLDAGTYGTCELCGKEVTAARLEAVPSARFCIEHA